MLGILETVSIATPAITAENILSGSVSIGGEVQENFYASPYPVITVGNMEVVFSFTTTDPAVLALVQSQIVTTVTFTYKGVQTEINASTFDLTQEADTLTYVLSVGYVQDVIEVAGDNNSKSPIEYTVTIKACKDGATEPTITKTYSAGVV